MLRLKIKSAIIRVAVRVVGYMVVRKEKAIYNYYKEAWGKEYAKNMACFCYLMDRVVKNVQD